MTRFIAYYRVSTDKQGKSCLGLDAQRQAVAGFVAETLLIPVQPRSFDIWAVDQMAELVKEAREINADLRVFAVLNAADAQGRDNADAGEAVKEVEGITLWQLQRASN